MFSGFSDVFHTFKVDNRLFQILITCLASPNVLLYANPQLSLNFRVALIAHATVPLFCLIRFLLLIRTRRKASFPSAFASSSISRDWRTSYSRGIIQRLVIFLNLSLSMLEPLLESYEWASFVVARLQVDSGDIWASLNHLLPVNELIILTEFRNPGFQVWYAVLRASVPRLKWPTYAIIVVIIVFFWVRIRWEIGKRVSQLVSLLFVVGIERTWLQRCLVDKAECVTQLWVVLQRVKSHVVAWLVHTLPMTWQLWLYMVSSSFLLQTPILISCCMKATRMVRLHVFYHTFVALFHLADLLPLFVWSFVGWNGSYYVTLSAKVLVRWTCHFPFVLLNDFDLWKLTLTSLAL